MTARCMKPKLQLVCKTLSQKFQEELEIAEITFTSLIEEHVFSNIDITSSWHNNVQHYKKLYKTKCLSTGEHLWSVYLNKYDSIDHCILVWAYNERIRGLYKLTSLAQLSNPFPTREQEEQYNEKIKRLQHLDRKEQDLLGIELNRDYPSIANMRARDISANGIEAHIDRMLFICELHRSFRNPFCWIAYLPSDVKQLLWYELGTTEQVKDCSISFICKKWQR